MIEWKDITEEDPKGNKEILCYLDYGNNLGTSVVLLTGTFHGDWGLFNTRYHEFRYLKKENFQGVDIQSGEMRDFKISHWAYINQPTITP